MLQMTKRFLLPGFLFFFLCVFVCNATKAQDTTKKAEPEKKAEPVTQQAVTKPSIQPAAKPLYRHHRISPAVNPPAATTNPAQQAAKTTQPVASATKDTTQPDLKTPADPNQLNAKSLNNQYQYMLSKTLRFQQPLLGALWKNVTDTLTKVRNDAKSAQAKVSADDKLIDSLKTAAINAAKEQASAQASSAPSDTISMFGISLSKSTYNMVMVSLVVGLALALTIVIGTTAKHKHEAKHRTELYEEIEEEFKTYKAKATEKELRLARELQTERNKLDELLGRG
jgi:preprotein translocase subunit SecG